MTTKTMRAKRKAVALRLARFEEELRRGREYLETGEHANWHGFRALFGQNRKDGEAVPPHKDWVKNVFLRRAEKGLARAEKVLEQLERAERAPND